MMPNAVKAAVATLIRDQDNAARHPFTISCLSNFVGTDQASCSTPSIPAAGEVVIETVGFSAGALPSTNTHVEPVVGTTASGVSVVYPLNSIAENGVSSFKPTFTTTQSVRLYADPGTAILCLGQTKGANPVFGLIVECHFSGYSVSFP
jgi:hypothetical protein